MKPFSGVVIVPPGFDEDTPVVGLPPVLRHVLALQEAGATQVAVLGGRPPEDARIRVPVRTSSPVDGAVVVTSAAVTYHRGLPARIAHSPPSDVDAGVVRYGSSEAAIHWAPAEHADALVRAVSSGTTVEALTGALEPGEFVLLATTPAQRAASRRHHLRSLIKPTSGIIDRRLMRPFSLPITSRLLSTGVTPTQVTVLSIVLALVAAGLVAVPTLATTLAGAALHLWVRILDCVDGELARIRYQTSRRGEWIDSVGDVLGIAALVGAVTWRAGHDDPSWLAFGVGGIALYLFGQVLQAWATFEATGGGAVQGVRWSFQAPAPSGVQRMLRGLHNLARVDFISTAYALLIMAGLFRVLLVAHAIASSLAAVYFVVERARAGAVPRER